MPSVPITLVSANIGQNKTLPANGSIELGFDRLLLPASITRQTFVLENVGGTKAYTPNIAYDPVARIVTITPLTDPAQVLVSGQSYGLVILVPQNAADPNGLRAIDGATLAGGSREIAFTVTDAGPTPAVPVIDFCRDINLVIQDSCSLGTCHGAPTPAAGLQLYPFSGIPLTAIGRVAQGSNTGPRSAASPPSLFFGEDMPTIDANGNTTGNPGNSWLMYKLLLAMPSPEPVDAGAGPIGPAEAGAEDATVPSADAGAEDATVPSADAGADAGADASAGVDAGADAGAGVDAGADAGAMEAGTPVPVMPPPIDVSGDHAPLVWQGITDAERATLSNYIQGREMPFPPLPNNLSSSTAPLTLDQLERFSLWISQGAPSSATCP